MTRDEVCDFLRISSSTLDSMLEAHKFKGITFHVGRQRRFVRDRVIEKFYPKI